MDRAERRKRRLKKIKQREQIVKANGFKYGSLYEKHINKIIENGSGYMSKHGTLLHYANGTNPKSQKVRDRSSYNGTNNWKPNDRRKIDSMNYVEY